MPTRPRTPDAPLPPERPAGDHQGNALPAGARPPVGPPPAAIGRLVSVDPTWRRRAIVGGPWAIAIGFMVATTLLPALFILPLGMAADAGVDHTVRRRGAAPPPPRATSAVAMTAAVLFDVAAAVALGWGLVWAFRRRPTTTYLGTDGVAVLRGSRSGAVRSVEALRFADAADLFTESTRHSVNSAYVRTTYAFRWQDAAGVTLLRLAGSHRGDRGTPKPRDAYHFARAAELAWTDHLLARTRADLDRDRYLEFRVNRADAVRVGHGVMEFTFGSRTERVTAGDIARASLDAGKFHIATKDARFFGRSGKFHFAYGRMANAQAFLAAVDRLVGVRFG